MACAFDQSWPIGMLNGGRWASTAAQIMSRIASRKKSFQEIETSQLP